MNNDKHYFYIYLTLFLIVLPSIYSVSLIPSGDILLKNKHSIVDAINTTSQLYCTGSTCGNVSEFLNGGDTNTQWVIDGNYLQNISDTLTFNETKMNETIDAKQTGGSMWNITGSQYLVNLSNILDVNDTVLNNTIDTRNTWTNTQSKPFTGVDVVQGLRILSNILSINHSYFEELYNRWIVVGDYLYNDSTTIYYNETKLNETITTLDTDTDTHVKGDDIYLTNDSTIMYFDETKLNTTIDTRQAVGGNNNSIFVNKTGTIYTANFTNGTITGYIAGNELCAEEFTGTHLCSFAEIEYTIASVDLSTLDGWDGTAWMGTGAAKYAPADLPVNDCNGFKHGVAGSYLGNWWAFNKSTGGEGKTGHCGNSISLACCQ